MIIQFKEHTDHNSNNIHHHLEKAVCCIDKLMQCINDIKDCCQLLEQHEEEDPEEH